MVPVVEYIKIADLCDADWRTVRKVFRGERVRRLAYERIVKVCHARGHMVPEQAPPDPGVITQRDMRRMSVWAQCDWRTIKRYLEGQVPRSAWGTARIEETLSKFGHADRIIDLLPDDRARIEILRRDLAEREESVAIERDVLAQKAAREAKARGECK